MEIHEGDIISQRSLFFSPITQAPIIHDSGDLMVWADEAAHTGSLAADVSDPMWYVVKATSGMSCQCLAGMQFERELQSVT